MNPSGYRKDKNVFLANTLACLFLLIRMANTNAQPAHERITEKDTTHIYPLDDPRNPRCPCHEYQKQAEKEYARILEKNDSKLRSYSWNMVYNTNSKKTLLKRSFRSRRKQWFIRNRRNKKQKIKKHIDGCSIF
jgi:hypothetical protein